MYFSKVPLESNTLNFETEHRKIRKYGVAKRKRLPEGHNLRLSMVQEVGDRKAKFSQQFSGLYERFSRSSDWNLRENWPFRPFLSF